jgi:predicted DNA-binding antitoxin AbrB/MazE fold protein
MNEILEAVFENGVFRPLGEITLPEGEHVFITISTTNGGISDPAYNLASIAEETGIDDLAVNIDHYLYGLPKRADE